MNIKKKIRTFFNIIKKYSIFGLPYSFVLTLHLIYRIYLKHQLTSKGTCGILVELYNKKLMLLDPYDIGLSYDILLNEKKLRENYASEYLLNNLEKNEGVFFDLGANLGYYTVLLSDYFNRIICVEPVLNSVKFLEKNVLLNRICEKVKIVNCAIAPKNGTVYFEDNERKNLVQISKGTIGTPINAYTIETICRENNISKIDFLKMDVEGYEYEIIVVGNKSFSKFAPKRIFVEIHFDILGREKSEELLQTLNKNGYYVEAAFIEIKDILYWLRGFPRKIYKAYLEFLIGRKIGLVYKNVEISKIIDDEKIINGKVGAIEFILKKRDHN